MKNLVMPFRLACIILMLNLIVACNVQGIATNLTPIVVESTIEATPQATITLQANNTSSGRFLEAPLDPNLVDTQWQLIELNNEPFPDDMKMIMRFTSEGIEGHTGCNKWLSSGGLTAKDGVFSIPEIAKTADGCARSTLEKEAVNTIIKATSYFLQKDMLILQNEDGGQSLIFIPLAD